MHEHDFSWGRGKDWGGGKIIKVFYALVGIQPARFFHR